MGQSQAKNNDSEKFEKKKKKFRVHEKKRQIMHFVQIMNTFQRGVDKVDFKLFE